MHLPKTIVLLSILALLFVGAFGASFAGTAMGHGETIGCPLASHSVAVCDMSPLEHLSTWQAMFAATLAQNPLLLLIALFSVLFFVSVGWLRALLTPQPYAVRLAYAPHLVSHDPLRRFTARGLLHPKIF